MIQSAQRTTFSFILSHVVFGCVAIAFLSLCGCSGQKTDIVFDVKFDGFTDSGRPLIEISPNGEPRPDGLGPFGDYFLILRPGDTTPYSRQFDKDQAAKGIKLDFAITKDDLKKMGVPVTVAVENPEGSSFDKSIRLSNVCKVPLD